MSEVACVFVALAAAALAAAMISLGGFHVDRARRLDLIVAYLREQGPTYGLDLCYALREAGEGDWRGLIYLDLARLEREGRIASAPDPHPACPHGGFGCARCLPRRRYWALLALLALGLTTGCGPASRSPTSPSITVAFVGSWAPSDILIAQAAVELHEARFRSTWGALPSFDLEVYPGPLLPDGNPAESHLTPTHRTVRVAAGPDLVLAGLTHELHHVAHDPREDHADPRWPSWDLEDQATVAALRASR